MTGSLTMWQQRIIDYLSDSDKEWHSPTEIGEEVGRRFYNSSWACARLKPLVKAGLVERSDKGLYRIVKEAK